LIPWLSLLYLLAFLDRTNIGNAKIADLTADIPMDNKKYSFTLMIFFISYGLMTARFFLGVTEAGLYPGVNY
jgi:hypothetical protein